MLLRDGSQFTSMLIHPRIDGGIAFDSTVESQQFRSHRHSIFAFWSMLRGTLQEERKGLVLRNDLAVSDGTSWQRTFSAVQSMNSN
jgi:hypothetical protein